MRLGAPLFLAALGGLASTLPAAAQTSQLQTLLPLTLILPPQSLPTSVTASSVARGFNLAPAPLPTSRFLSPDDPERKIAAPARSPAPESAERTTAPKITSTQQPSEVGISKSAPPVAPPVTAASQDPSAVVRSETLPNKVIVDRANAYFTAMTSLVASFTQVNGEGQRLGGTLYLQRPGKVRFDYDPPTTLEVVADGSSVAVRDTKLATQDLYSIAQTPLKFLLRDKVDLNQDTTITGIVAEPDSVRIALEDRSTLGGTSRILLYFDPQIQTLTQWRILDPQGIQTTVLLNKVQKGRAIDPDMFKIQYEAILGGNK